MLTSTCFPGEGWKVSVEVQDYEHTSRFAVVAFKHDDMARGTHSIHLPGMGPEQAKFARRLAMQLLRAADELEQPPAPAPSPAVCANCKGTGWFDGPTGQVRCALCDSDGADTPPAKLGDIIDAEVRDEIHF